MAKATKTAAKKSSSKRTLIAPKGDKRYVRRNEKGEFTESDDVSRSLSQDKKRKAKKTSKPGQGDKGDSPAKKAPAKKSAAKKAPAKKSAAKKSASKKK